MKTTVLLTGLLFVATFGYAQMDVPGKVRDKANQRAETKVDQAIDGALDKTEEGIKNATKKKGKKSKQKKEKQIVENKSNSTNVSEQEQQAASSKPNSQDDQPSLKAYSNYDFIAGNKVLFFDDFSNGKIGDFPVMWNTTGSGEIVTTSKYPGNWFRINPISPTFLDAGLKSVENFTIEFDLIVNKTDNLVTADGWDFQISLFSSDHEIDGLFSTSLYPGKDGINLNFATVSNNNSEETQNEHSYRVYDNKTEKSFEGKNNKKTTLLEPGKQYRFSFWVQNTRLRLYINEEKVYDIQRAFSAKTIIDQIRFSSYDDPSANILIFISNFRHADATEDTRSKFLTDGKLVSYGIYFDSGKDVVKPQSYGALKEMATILIENPSVKVQIVGHTDSDGDDAMNLDLSKRRAENVKKVLISEFKIDAGRITTDGKGESEPITPNTNAEDKAKNRRVEFIKL
jgi:OmpA-OmpF porin, OOP family